MAKLYLGLSLFAGGLLAWACSSEKNTAFPPSTNTTTVTHTNTDGTTDTVTVTTTDTNTGVGIETDTEVKPDPNAPPRREKVCDAAGNCKCINLASIGAAAKSSYGTGSDSTNEFESWLSNKSNANVTFFIDKPGTIDMTWLNNFDVILIQDLTKWVFTVQEQQAFQQWINEGGGVIALSGYESKDSVEILNPNGLLAPTGMSILADEVPDQSTCTTQAGIESSEKVCPFSDSNPNPNRDASRCYCWGGSYPVTDFTATHPIALNVKAIGAFRGRAVNVGTGNVVASIGTVPVAGEITVGKGKVFIFGDEWVTYTSQWTTGGQAATTVNPYDPCWTDPLTAADNTSTEPVSKFTSCLAGQVFQAKQFWYNAVAFVSPTNTACNFVIEEPEVIIIQ